MLNFRVFLAHACLKPFNLFSWHLEAKCFSKPCHCTGHVSVLSVSVSVSSAKFAVGHCCSWGTFTFTTLTSWRYNCCFEASLINCITDSQWALLIVPGSLIALSLRGTHRSTPRHHTTAPDTPITTLHSSPRDVHFPTWLDFSEIQHLLTWGVFRSK